MPNFLVIGAGKAGTTALYEYLDQHPQIYMSPVKETNFFALEGERAVFRGPGVQERINSWSVTNIEDYQALFDRASDETALGEACPLYLYSPKAPGRIRHHVPDAKLIAILRNPVERAYSAFTHLIRDGREPFDNFERALEEEETRIADNWPWIWHYKRVGFYHKQLSRYFDIFDREQIKIYLYDDLRVEPTNVLPDMFRFLGVDAGFTTNVSTKHNVSGVPKNKALHSFLMTANPIKESIKPLVPTKLRRRMVLGVRNRNLDRPPQLSPELRRQLIGVFREDVLNLQDFVQRDLGNWLE
jgi:hypothetical protein